jgi:splicing factor 3A subunit 2
MVDRQNRVGSRFRAGQVSQGQEQQARRERLRKLAMETIDVSKDPYFMRNHLGTYECKLCLTLHNNEGNYLAHTQGKRHQTNLARRAAREARDAPVLPQPAGAGTVARVRVRKNIVRIGRPGYRVTKRKDPETGQRSLLFEIQYPDIEPGGQPRHRFMSAYEQRVEPPDKNVQYLLFAGAPYETIAFKVPNLPVDKGEGKFLCEWEKEDKIFRLQLHFEGRQSIDKA